MTRGRWSSRETWRHPDGHVRDTIPAGGGPAFAAVYLALFAWYAYQWWVVHRIDDPAYRGITSRYLVGMLVTIVAMGFSIAVPDAARVAIWAIIVVAWTLGGFVAVATTRVVGFAESLTSSMVERFGLFTIVVLGEVVIGVVQGLGEVEERAAMTVPVAMLGLAVGMGLWWSYFDALGRRVPSSRSGVRLGTWTYVHLPITLSIAAAGAAMVTLVEHAGDSRAPAATAWLLGGSVAVALLCIGLASMALQPENRSGLLLRRAPTTLAAGAVVVLGIAALRPPPIVLVGALSATLALTWLTLAARAVRAGGRLGEPAGAHTS